MNKTNIEWCDYSLNLITGCLNHTNGLCKSGGFLCYAWLLANTRLKGKYLENHEVAPYPNDYSSCNIKEKPRVLDPFYPRLWDRFTVKGIPKGSRIFLNDMSDWVGIGIPEEWTQKVLDFIRANPDYAFLTLTKQPQNLPRWFPNRDKGGLSNCWSGSTVTNDGMMKATVEAFDDLWAPVKFISFEPLLGGLSKESLKQIRDCVCDWLIIGACTGTKAEMSELVRKYPDLYLMPLWQDHVCRKYTVQPRIEWIQEIVEVTDRAGIPVFLKDNLKPLIGIKNEWAWTHWDCNTGLPELRQEFPEGRMLPKQEPKGLPTGSVL